MSNAVNDLEDGIIKAGFDLYDEIGNKAREIGALVSVEVPTDQGVAARGGLVAYVFRQPTPVVGVITNQAGYLWFFANGLVLRTTTRAQRQARRLGNWFCNGKDVRVSTSTLYPPGAFPKGISAIEADLRATIENGKILLPTGRKIRVSVEQIVSPGAPNHLSLVRQAFQPFAGQAR
jgi:hypothetical protein